MTMSSSSHAKSASRTKNIICSPRKTYAEESNEHFDAQRAIRSHAHNARYKQKDSRQYHYNRQTDTYAPLCNECNLIQRHGPCGKLLKRKMFSTDSFKNQKKRNTPLRCKLCTKKTMEFSWDKRHSIAESEQSYTHVQK